MHPRSPLLSFLAVLALVAFTAPEAASAKYKECEFSKSRAKKKKAPRCTKSLTRSKWIVVSGEYVENLGITETTDTATFNGTATAEFDAGGLDGANRFPTRKEPAVAWVSKATYDHQIDFSMVSTGGWTTKKRSYDCGLSYGNEVKPFGFGGIFMLAGKNVRVQWLVGATGFGCGTAPYPPPSADFPTPVETYKLASFKNRRVVVLPIAFDHAETAEGFNARRVIDGVARLRRYR